MFKKSKPEPSNTTETANPEPSLKEKTMKALNSTHSNTTTLISAGTEIIGDIKVSGDLEIEGKVSGNIISSGADSAVVRVLADGEVIGNIEVPTVIINGMVQGNINSSSHLEMAEKASVEGDVEYSIIEMAKGAHVYGRLLSLHHRPASEAKNATKDAKMVPPTASKSSPQDSASV